MLQSYKGLMMYEMNKKSMIVAYILGFLLGFTGIHAFYLQENGHGAFRLAVFLLSFLIPPLMAISILVYLMDSIWTWFWVDGYDKRLLELYAQEK